jgi:Flp pilus assembly protein TadB
VLTYDLRRQLKSKTQELLLEIDQTKENHFDEIQEKDGRIRMLERALKEANEKLNDVVSKLEVVQVDLSTQSKNKTKLMHWKVWICAFFFFLYIFYFIIFFFGLIFIYTYVTLFYLQASKQRMLKSYQEQLSKYKRWTNVDIDKLALDLEQRDDQLRAVEGFFFFFFLLVFIFFIY